MRLENVKTRDARWPMSETVSVTISVTTTSVCSISGIVLSTPNRTQSTVPMPHRKANLNQLTNADATEKSEDPVDETPEPADEYDQADQTDQEDVDESPDPTDEAVEDEAHDFMNHLLRYL